MAGLTRDSGLTGIETMDIYVSDLDSPVPRVPLAAGLPLLLGGFAMLARVKRH